MIFMLIVFGALMTHFFTLTRVPQALTTFIAESGLGYFGIVTSMVIFYIILGMFLEAMSLLLITIPILYPIATAAGIDHLSFGIRSDARRVGNECVSTFRHSWSPSIKKQKKHNSQ